MLKFWFKTFAFSAVVLAAATASANDKIVCTRLETIKVFDDKLQKVIFLADRFEAVKPFQGWGVNRKIVKHQNTEYAYIKVQFTDREEEDAEQSIGWIPELVVTAKSECKNYVEPLPEPLPEPIEETPVAEETPAEENQPAPVLGLEDPNCCRFPLASSAKASFMEDPRRFGSPRSKGRRKHAACDLYHRTGEPVLAVAPGKIVRDLYYFYLGTYAIEVQHPGGFIVRYGEVSGKKAPRPDGMNVAMGQELGYIQKMRCCEPMLHFELYKGTGKGALTVLRNKGFQRRSDLLNPTKYLQQWESPR